jgi:amidase
MAFPEYASLDGIALGELVRKREITPLELLDEAISRAERVNGTINALVYKFYDRAREAARAVRTATGAFEGVPFLLKDLLGDCQGVPTRFASRYVPELPALADSELVARYKRAGLIPFAKTNAPEFGLPPVTEPQLYGPARNPWNPAHTPGGSSGGSAAAVAAGIVPLAHANDGGGSIRIPAACCGLVGLKPTRARNSLAPLLGDIMSGLVVEHVVSRTVRDSAAALDATAGYVPGDPYVAPAKARSYLEEVGTPPPRLKIAFSTLGLSGEPPDPECAEAAVQAAKLCAGLGHHVEEDAPRIEFAEVGPAFLTVYAAGHGAVIETVKQVTGREPTPDLLESMTWNLYETSRRASAAQYLLAVGTLQTLSRRMAAFFEKYDVWLAPALGLRPLRVGAIDFTSPTATILNDTIARFAYINPLYNVSGQPAISLPLYWTGDGLPIGALFGARFGDEATLFRLAGELEGARPWASRKPPLWP